MTHVSTHEIELHTEALMKFRKEHQQTLQWLLHNFSVIKEALDTSAKEDDLIALQVALAALQAELDALEAAVAAIDVEEFDPSSILAAIADLQAQIDAIVIPPFPPPFTMPSGGVDGDVLTHGPGGVHDFFWASPCAPVLAVPDGYQITDEKCGTIFIGL